MSYGRSGNKSGSAIMEASFCKYELVFKRPSGTSRGVMNTKETYFIIVKEGDRFGIGECGLLKGLSVDDPQQYEIKLSEICENIHKGLRYLLDLAKEFPSIQFGLEQVFMSFNSEDPFLLFSSFFTSGGSSIPINGLIWMGEEDFLHRQLDQKIKSGFKCIKLKVGALDFDTEVRFLENLRKKYPADKIELRIDANGAFDPSDALDKLKVLSRFQLHSIEQPIDRNQWDFMEELCRVSPIDIALDEELIGIFDYQKKEEMLQKINPRYIILKPSLIGGYRGSTEWIDLAESRNIGWWITSALESNIGLNAIAQWTATLNCKIYQGLGTGSLYTNNFESPLLIDRGMLYYDQRRNWSENLLEKLCL